MEFSNTFLNEIKYFFNADLNATDTEHFFKNLHSNNSKKLVAKDFKLNVYDIGKMWGQFFGQYRYYCETQILELNSFENYKNSLYKKALQVITYLHETTHEKQRDYYLYNNERNIAETCEYNKMLNLEVFCSDNAKACTYEQRLVEIDAIHSSVMQYIQLFDANCMQKTPETLSVVLYACVRYMASINGQKHHTYFPEKFVVDSKNLVEYYKNYYLNLTHKNQKINDIITGDEYMDHAKKQEIRNINFDELTDKINNKTKDVLCVMQAVFNDLQGMYKPSKHFKTNFGNFNNFVSSNNLVKVAAVVCDDLHYTFTGKKPLFLEHLPNNNQDDICNL